jgi:hypothetical protein
VSVSASVARPIPLRPMIATAVYALADRYPRYTLLGTLDFAYEAANYALDALARSGTLGCAWGILWTEEMRAFRRDARFQSLVQRLGLMDYWRHYGPPDGCELRDGSACAIGGHQDGPTASAVTCRQLPTATLRRQPGADHAVVNSRI